MARRGRKRKAGERFPNGHIKPAIDRGTPELQATRKYYAGNGDPALTIDVIGILRARNQITLDEYESASDYRKLFALVYRKPEISAAGGANDPSGVLSDEKIIEFKLAMKILERAVNSVVQIEGRKAKDIWDNIVLYSRGPNWMEPCFPLASDMREAELFKMVLRAVTLASGRGEKIRAA